MKTKVIKQALLSIAILLCGAAARAQTAVAYPVVGVAWHQPQVFVPNTPTAITTQDSLAGHLHLANVTGSTVLVTITDNSTNCNGSACQPWPTIPIAGNTVYDTDFGGMLFTGGIKWSANTQNAVDGYLRGNYTIGILSQNLSLPSPFGGIPVPLFTTVVAEVQPRPFTAGWKNGTVTGTFP